MSAPPPPRVCALIPTYDNPQTLGAVARETLRHLPLVLVDDGSAEAGRSVAEEVAREPRVSLVRHASNRGKGAALRSGFALARRLGYSHVITLDADGQHLPGDLPDVLAALHARPDALILGQRDLREAGAGWGSRSGRWLSNAWFRLVSHERGLDTQTGFRVYPLGPLAELRLEGERYELEVEVLAKAAWSGIPLVSTPIRVRYFGSVSHMGLRDFARISGVWLRLGGRYLLERARRVIRSDAQTSPARVSSASSSQAPSAPVPAGAALGRRVPLSSTLSPGPTCLVNLSKSKELSPSEVPSARLAASALASTK